MKSMLQYLSLVKFSHTLFALPFALIGFALGWRSLVVHYPMHPITSLSYNGIALQLLLVVLSMVACRNAAMAFNRFLDRHVDALNPRTAKREIPSGTIRAENALVFVLVNACLFVACTFFINRICFYLSPVALAVVLGYSYTKRFTQWCHLVLGLGLSLAPIGAYLAVTGRFDWLPLFFSFAVVAWVAGFDIIYALQDEAFDRSHQLYSIPVRWGSSRALHISRVLHLFAAASLALAGLQGGFRWPYGVGWVVFSGMLVYQHRIISPRDLSRVNVAFMTANGVASIVFALCTIADILWQQFSFLNS